MKSKNSMSIAARHRAGAMAEIWRETCCKEVRQPRSNASSAPSAECAHGASLSIIVCSTVFTIRIQLDGHGLYRRPSRARLLLRQKAASAIRLRRFLRYACRRDLAPAPIDRVAGGSARRIAPIRVRRLSLLPVCGAASGKCVSAPSIARDRRPTACVRNYVS